MPTEPKPAGAKRRVFAREFGESVRKQQHRVIVFRAEQPEVQIMAMMQAPQILERGASAKQERPGVTVDYRIHSARSQGRHRKLTPLRCLLSRRKSILCTR